MDQPQQAAGPHTTGAGTPTVFTYQTLSHDWSIPTAFDAACMPGVFTYKAHLDVHTHTHTHTHIYIYIYVHMDGRIYLPIILCVITMHASTLPASCCPAWHPHTVQELFEQLDREHRWPTSEEGAPMPDWIRFSGEQQLEARATTVVRPSQVHRPAAADGPFIIKGGTVRGEGLDVGGDMGYVS